jgi:hypothetical protein
MAMSTAADASPRTQVVPVDPSISGRRPRAGADDYVAQLEAGSVLFLPTQGFDILPGERTLFTPALARAKNVSFDPATGRVGGTREQGPAERALAGLLGRFGEASGALVARLFPAYTERLERRRASFRPVEIAGRATSWRQDDTRLHVDSFPATPSGGRRILRVFTNVNPDARPRSWRVGEPFDRVAARFAPQLAMPWPGSATLLRLLGLTRTRRTPYDALMLQLHDAMKRDEAYQRSAPQTEVEFPAASTWIAFTDQVSHAAVAGQYQLEQTFLLPVDAMRAPARSPLHVLEAVMRRRLV